jgi:hypothetical protein
MKNYSYGSGCLGCIYDFGPHFTLDRSESSKNDAIESLLNVFSDLSESEETQMKENLRTDGIHYFSNPLEAGADYAEINEHSMSKQEYDKYDNS